jgi:hypothetical protein
VQGTAGRVLREDEAEGQQLLCFDFLGGSAAASLFPREFSLGLPYGRWLWLDEVEPVFVLDLAQEAATHSFSRRLPVDWLREHLALRRRRTTRS